MERLIDYICRLCVNHVTISLLNEFILIDDFLTRVVQLLGIEYCLFGLASFVVFNS